MGNGMKKLVPGLYLGSIRDSSDKKQLEDNSITHIVTIHEHPSKDAGIKNIKYLRFKAMDNSQQDIKQFFVEAIDFIHEARLNDGVVLVHCLAGVSRSASLCIAYLMTITGLPWYDTLNSVRAAREQANPNFGFQRQLQNFEHTSIKNVRENLYKKYGEYDNTTDLETCMKLLTKYKEEQKELTRINGENSQNKHKFVTPKTYSLPFNAYKMDEEKKKNEKTKKSEAKTSSDSIEEVSPEEKKRQKEEVMQKIFGTE